MTSHKIIKAKGLGQSMKPLIDDGDFLVVDARNKRIKAGDIVVVLWNKRLIAHRVVYFDDKIIVTKGDNSIFLDKPVIKTQILGKVSRILKEKSEYEINHFGGAFPRWFFLAYSIIPSYIAMGCLKIARIIFYIPLALYFIFTKKAPRSKNT